MTWPDECPHNKFTHSAPFCCCNLTRGFPLPGRCPLERGEWGAWRSIGDMLGDLGSFYDDPGIFDAPFRGTWVRNGDVIADVFKQQLAVVGWLP